VGTESNKSYYHPVERRETMSWAKIISVTAPIIFAFGIATMDYAVAAEKVKFKSEGTFYSAKWEKIKVGDEEGHIIGIYETKGLYFDEITGERLVDRAVGFMDINTKTGRGFVRGYGVETNSDGDKRFRSFEGKPLGKIKWEGVWTITKCTGKLEGTKGAGTWIWTSYDLIMNQGSVEMEGEMETP
jgi:hypothetical protein